MQTSHGQTTKERHAGHKATAAMVALLSLLAGCSGLVDGAATGPTGSGPGGNNNGEDDGGVPMVRPKPPQGTDPVELAPARIWRLTPTQYERAFVAAFGATTVHASDLPHDAVEDGFDNNAGQAYVDSTLARAYYDNAVAMAARISGSFAGDSACLNETNPDDGCVTGLIRYFADRAFRRPATDEEVANYLALYRSVQVENGSKDAAAAVLEVIAQAPAFLYRSEIGGDATDGETRLTQYEIASELSFMLTDGPPDAELLDAADAGSLYDRATVQEQAQRLLETDAAREKVGRFFSQYLEIGSLEDGAVGKDATVYPSNVYNPTLQHDMWKETTEFAKHVVFDGEGTLTELFTSRTSFVTQRLAAVYGMTTVTGNDVQTMVELPEGERAGIMTQASVLTVRAKGNDSDPLHRGLFVYRNLLCKKIAPPNNVDVTMLAEQLKSPEPGSTKREDFEYLQKNSPECASCHGTFVPLGLSFEKFDAIGQFRKNENLNVTGKLSVGSSEDGNFADGAELMKRVAESDVGQACFAQRYATFALGRTTPISTKTVLASAFQKTEANIRDLFVAVTLDDVFYYRTVSEEGSP